MSRSAHAQSTYRLMEMPRCKKCRGSLQLVAAIYEGEKEYREEWECSKCSRIYQKNKIRPLEPLLQDKQLSERLNGENKRYC